MSQAHRFTFNPTLVSLPLFLQAPLRSISFPSTAGSYGVIRQSCHMMTHLHTLHFRILPSQRSLFGTVPTGVYSQTSPNSRNAQFRNLTSTPKSHHTNISKKATQRDLAKVDVVIIGAGPAGLMMASSLVRAGIPFRIIERRYVCDQSTLPHSPPRVSHLFS